MTGPVVYIVTKNGVTKLSATEWARHQQPRLRRATQLNVDLTGIALVARHHRQR